MAGPKSRASETRSPRPARKPAPAVPRDPRFGIVSALAIVTQFAVMLMLGWLTVETDADRDSDLHAILTAATALAGIGGLLAAALWDSGRKPSSGGILRWFIGATLGVAIVAVALGAISTIRTQGSLWPLDLLVHAGAIGPVTALALVAPRLAPARSYQRRRDEEGGP